jgi:N-methylhydantoinase A
MRIAVDTGGTFTDLVLEDAEGRVRVVKRATTPDDPVEGVFAVLGGAAEEMGISLEALLREVSTLIHATTHGINAILTGNTARTALLTTAGHPDILLFREGGRTDIFDYAQEYPAPYVPRSLTFEIVERMRADGSVDTPLDESSVIAAIDQMGAAEVEAVAVCLLWSIANPAHELRVAELVREGLPEVPLTLSHALNPTLREYRRASSTAIDASLKPVLSPYLARLQERLAGAGFGGRVLVVTSTGGLLDIADVADQPIHAIGSGPAMAPIAGRHYAEASVDARTAIVADAGGTSYDVTLVREGSLPRSRDAWLGEPYVGHLTGFPSIDVKSIGAGGGSVAWVDQGGMLRVGPQSAGAIPGPACYGRGGTEPTVTDAALALGYLDPAFFLGGRFGLNVDAARSAIEHKVAEPLGTSLEGAASGIMTVATELMSGAIEEITVNQGVDPAEAVLVCGGGAAGLNAVAIARRLNCRAIVIPEVAGTLSAAGALLSDLVYERGALHPTRTDRFDFKGVNETVAELMELCRQFVHRAGNGFDASEIELLADARYPGQAWELETGVPDFPFADRTAVETFATEFHRHHERVFAISEDTSPVEIVSFTARVRCQTGCAALGELVEPRNGSPLSSRVSYWPDTEFVEAKVIDFSSLNSAPIQGPALIQAPVTTVVVDPGASAVRSGTSLIVSPVAP